MSMNPMQNKNHANNAPKAGGLAQRRQSIHSTDTDFQKLLDGAHNIYDHTVDFTLEQIDKECQFFKMDYEFNQEGDMVAQYLLFRTSIQTPRNGGQEYRFIWAAIKLDLELRYDNQPISAENPINNPDVFFLFEFLNKNWNALKITGMFTDRFLVPKHANKWVNSSFIDQGFDAQHGFTKVIQEFGSDLPFTHENITRPVYDHYNTEGLANDTLGHSTVVEISAKSVRTAIMNSINMPANGAEWFDFNQIQKNNFVRAPSVRNTASGYAVIDFTEKSIGKRFFGLKEYNPNKPNATKLLRGDGLVSGTTNKRNMSHNSARLEFQWVDKRPFKTLREGGSRAIGLQNDVDGKIREFNWSGDVTTVTSKDTNEHMLVKFILTAVSQKLMPFVRGNSTASTETVDVMGLGDLGAPINSEQVNEEVLDNMSTIPQEILSGEQAASETEVPLETSTDGLDEAFDKKDSA